MVSTDNLREFLICQFGKEVASKILEKRKGAVKYWKQTWCIV